MLDVLDAHAVGSPQEDGERVRRVDEALDLDARGLGVALVLVRRVDEHVAAARDLGVEIDDVVDAPNTLAVFVWGPERVRIEYVEHKPTFSLT